MIKINIDIWMKCSWEKMGLVLAYAIAENTKLCDYMGAWTLLQEEKVGAYCTEHKDIYVALLILTSNSSVLKNYCICMGLSIELL